jgi:lycopene beta-cyclase
MHTYDYIIAGAGAAGLSLAYKLVHNLSPESSILLIDRDNKRSNDRTWCFWILQDMGIETFVSHQWKWLIFNGENFQKKYDLHPYTYKMIRGIDFYNKVRNDFADRSNVQWIQGSVDEIIDGELNAMVKVDGCEYHGKWVFDSTFNPADFHPDPARYHNLAQHFLGWEIETSEDVFDPSVATMFDFRTPQKGAMRFMYILPFSPRSALVEYTLFSADLLDTSEYEQELQAYIQNVLKVSEYRIETVEKGIIPMTDMPFTRRAGRRILNIGTKGGLVKPSTGYSFLRSQHDTAAIVASLQKTGHPFEIPSASRLHLFLDSIMLNLMYRRGGIMKRIFTELFKNNPIQRIFRFLDEETPPLELIQVLLSVPPWPFIKALFRLKILRKV